MNHVEKEKLNLQTLRLSGEIMDMQDQYMDLLEGILSAAFNVPNEELDKMSNEAARFKDEIDEKQRIYDELKSEINGTNLDLVMGVREASFEWDLAEETIKNMCANGDLLAKKIGKMWVIDIDQPNPTKYANNSNIYYFPGKRFS